MNVKLSPLFEDYIRQSIESGAYQNASEVIRESLRLKMEKDAIYQAKLEGLRRDINEALASPSEPWNFDTFMTELDESLGK